MIHHTNRNYRLEKLYSWLDYELSAGLLFLVSFFFSFAFYVFLIIAIIFTPYLLRTLYLERKYGWILGFLLLVVAPSFVFFYLFGNMPVAGLQMNLFGPSAGQQILTSSVPIALYVIYCYFLKVSIQ